jgi:acyl-CoA synthetase (AMP-forming)/AMP-acid ligase II
MVITYFDNITTNHIENANGLRPGALGWNHGREKVRPDTVAPLFMLKPPGLKKKIEFLVLYDCASNGCMGEEGYYYIVSRPKEMIVRGGENIYPKKIKKVVCKHPEWRKRRSGNGKNSETAAGGGRATDSGGT